MYRSSKALKIVVSRENLYALLFYQLCFFANQEQWFVKQNLWSMLNCNNQLDFLFSET